MLTEVAATIATLCMISAGDKPAITTTPDIIETIQRHCHAFYAQCVKKYDIGDCMIRREEKSNHDEKVTK